MQYLSEIFDALGLLFMLGLAYSFGGLNSKINHNGEMISKTYIEVTQLNEHLKDAEERIQKNEDTKVSKEEFNELVNRFVKLETKHNVIHKE